MKKKSSKVSVGIVLVIAGVIGFSGSPLGALILIGIGVVLIVFGAKQKNTNTTPSPQTLPMPVEKNATSTPDGKKDYNLFLEHLEGQFLCYEYENEICFIKGDSLEEKFGFVVGNGGKQLSFRFEPDNQYDNMAVAIYLDDKKLGYVYQGQTQEMIHSYHKQGRLICAYLNKYSVESHTATYKIGFYKPTSCFESKQFTLTKTSKKIDEYTTRHDNLSCCSAGDLLLIEKEFLEDNYVVTTDSYNEIGELPKSAVNFIEDYNPKKIYALFDNCEEDESGKVKATITVYLI